MTWRLWCEIIDMLWLAAGQEACILEQLLCEGKLPLTCERCCHPLLKHEFDFGDGDNTTRSYCNLCFGHGKDLCLKYVGTYVEH